MGRVILFGNSTWCLYNFRLGLIEELLARGWQVHVVAPLDPTYDNSSIITEFEQRGVRFHSVTLSARGVNPIREALSLAKIFRALRRIDPDVVLTFTVKCNIYAALCRKALSFEQIANVPGLGEVFGKPGVLQRFVSLLYRLSFRGVSCVFFQNKGDRDHCVRARLLSRTASRLLPGSGVDLSRFSPGYPPRKPDRVVFLMFGRLLPQKGYYLFLETAHRVRAQLGTRAEFWIQGFEDKNRPESTALLRAIKSAEEAGDVRYIAATVNVLPVLQDVDVVVLPSCYNEGVPHSLLEAMASGKLIVTSAWKGCRETVEQGENGFFVSNQTPEELTHCAMRCATMSPAELRRMGHKSRRLAEERFDERIVIDRYMRQISAALDLEDYAPTASARWEPLRRVGQDRH